MDIFRELEHESGLEDIEAIVFGEIDKYSAAIPSNLRSEYAANVGEVLTLAEALPFITQETPEHSDPLPFIAYTASWILFVAVDWEYSRFEVFRLPRHPYPGWVPELITA